ncbi:MAG: acyl-ACP--UDP-N-acetylglucosamine O-acyltransferase, partial [Rhodospirillaceae bacterium]|nr:acyl-ACP--UDP-N-acetylglucosamine O-acyltransferase [Rhodospirillaceae bacterium]
MTNIHPTAIVEDGAKIGDEVEIGPYSVIGPNVTIESGVKIFSHVVVGGVTSIGSGTRIFPFASIGSEPQDLKYGGEVSRLEIGSNNTIREHVTMNPGTEGGGLLTKVGDNCLFMVGAHVAHDCQIGNNVILVNNATLAGHVEVGEFAIIGGLSAVHQFARIGKHAMLGGMSGAESDVIPYGMVIGNRGGLSGLNLVGIKRRGFDRETIHSLR